MALCGAWLLAWWVAGCGKKEEPAPQAATGAAKREARHARGDRAGDAGGKMTAPGVEPDATPAAANAPGGQGGPGARPEEPKELVTASGQKITLFGPMGPRLVSSFSTLGLGGDVSIEGDNTKGKIIGKTPDSSVEWNYTGEDYAADRFGAKLPPEAKRNSGFVVEGLVSEAAIQQARQMAAGASGADATPAEVTEAERKVRLEGAVYTTTGKASEIARKVAELSKDTFNALPEMGDEMGLLQGSKNLHCMIFVQQVPDSDTVQITAVETVAAPKHVLQFMEQLPAFIEQAKQQQEQRRQQEEARRAAGAGGAGGQGGG
jgi:hypothetical protein